MGLKESMEEHHESSMSAMEGFKMCVEQLRELHPKKTFSYDDILWMIEAAKSTRKEKFNTFLSRISNPDNN